MKFFEKNFFSRLSKEIAGRHFYLLKMLEIIFDFLTIGWFFYFVSRQHVNFFVALVDTASIQFLTLVQYHGE